MTKPPGDVTIDPTDEALLRLLRDNARLPTAELARLLKLSRTTVQSRLERLERHGVIEGYTVRLAQPFARSLIRAQVLITVVPKSAARAEAGLRRISQITALYSVSGMYDMIALVEAISVEQMDQAIDEIGALEGIERTVSSIILSTKFVRPGAV
ncbi:MAG: Lrp/AsnC family transcriptional regulator [Aliidongia sp.]